MRRLADEVRNIERLQPPFLLLATPRANLPLKGDQSSAVSAGDWRRVIAVARVLRLRVKRDDYIKQIMIITA